MSWAVFSPSKSACAGSTSASFPAADFVAFALFAAASKLAFAFSFSAAIAISLSYFHLSTRSCAKPIFASLIVLFFIAEFIASTICWSSNSSASDNFSSFSCLYRSPNTDLKSTLAIITSPFWAFFRSSSYLSIYFMILSSVIEIPPALSASLATSVFISLPGTLVVPLIFASSPKNFFNCSTVPYVRTFTLSLLILST